jgi:hypothetical protein
MTKTFDTFKDMKEMYADQNFGVMAKIVVDAAAKAQTMMAYCDYIAHLIQGSLKAEDTREESLLSSVGRSRLDLDSYGSLASTKKTIEVEDRNGKKYKITVEEA